MSTDTDSPSALSRLPRWRAVVELLSSMRFAISLLSVICIASIIGTVIRQGDPYGNYVNQFGPFWAELFGALGLYSVYSVWWFQLILAFLVLSTSLCISRNAPKIVTDLRAYKENLREQSLKAFHHKAEAALNETAEAAAQRIGQTLSASGWKVRLQSRQTPQGTGWMVAAKAGAANKLGYIAAHSAIVLVCVGALLDGDLMVRAQTWFNGKQVFTGGGLIADVPQQYRLSTSNPTFRGNLLVTEGSQSSTAILKQPEGVMLQELPFAVELKKFIVEYYSTGMPKLFASDIVIHDKATGAQTPARVEVNHPVRYQGIEIFQSSFDDGGSAVRLKALPMAAGVLPFEVKGNIGGSTVITNGDRQYTLEFSGLRVINVENFQDVGAGASAVDVRKVDLRSAIEDRLGAANKTVTQKTLRNVGPSITYKLRDSAGQAIEFHNYMLPVDLDGARVFLLGVRNTPAEAFRYLRLPVDDQDGLDGFVRLRAALLDPAQRERAVARYVARYMQEAGANSNPQLKQAIAVTGARALALFSGTDPVLATLKAVNEKTPLAGLTAVARYMEAAVPEAERERASESLVGILNGSLFELLQVSREQAGLKPLERSEATDAFMTQAVFSLSDSFLYPAPMTFALQDFQQVQASVFQVAKTPGRSVVYLGCLLLIIGIFAMLYVRERRLWVWLAPADAAGQTQARMALSINRKTLDVDRDFERLKNRLLQVNA